MLHRLHVCISLCDRQGANDSPAILAVNSERTLINNPFAQDAGGIEFFVLGSDTIVSLQPRAGVQSVLTVVVRDEIGR